jgi:hypothetical protein
MSGGSGRAGGDVEGVLRGGIASLSLAAALVHASVVPDHPGLPLHVAFFLVSAVLQSGLAAVVLRGRSGRWLALTAACNGVIAVIWVLSRTTGVPVEGAAAEPIGFKDAISTLLELGVVAGAGLVAVLPEASRRVPLRAGSLASTVMAAGVWGLAVAGLIAPHTHDDHLHLHGAGVEAAVESHHRVPGVAHGHDDDQTDVLMIDRPHHPMVPGLNPDHHDPVRRDRYHHHDARSEAFTDDGPAPGHGRTEHKQCQQHESDSIDRSDGTGDGQVPGSPAGSAGRLIDDVMRLLETVPRHTTALEVSP